MESHLEPAMETYLLIKLVDLMLGAVLERHSGGCAGFFVMVLMCYER